MSQADHLLCCAVTFHSCEPARTPCKETYKSPDEAVAQFMTALLFEANRGMQEPIAEPETPYLHPVDIDTREPGIITSKTKREVLRKKAPLPAVSYGRRTPQQTELAVKPAEPKSLTQAQLEAEKQQEKRLKTQERQATRELKAENKSREKIEARECAKKARQEETAEEREERLRAMREKRAQKKQEKERAEGAATTTTKEKRSTSVEPAQTIDTLLERETCGPVQTIMPTRLKARERKARFFPSPLPFDRHLSALQAAQPHPSLLPPLLRGEASDALVVISGPPGTGKTSALLEHIPERGRVLVCAPTNVGVANAYERIYKRHPDCALLLPSSRVPMGTPVLSQDPAMRIVCATISGRSGPILDGKEFETILVDEAAQTMEAWLWGLIRPAVRRIVMAGDVDQLPALVSQEGKVLGYDQSAMERLQKLGYPVTRLTEQRRMHPEIVAFVNESFYHDELTTAYTPRTGFSDAPFCVCQIECKEEAIGTSFQNVVEAEASIAAAKELIEQGLPNTIILTAYQAQARRP